jgi:hypothetical protein
MAVFPEKPVVKGGKWTTSVKTTISMPMTVKTTYELVDVTDSYFEIKGDATIITDKTTPKITGGMPFRYDMTGTIVSDIKADKKTGWITNSKVTQNIKGTATVEDTPNIPGGMSVPMTMTNEMTVTDK